MGILAIVGGFVPTVRLPTPTLFADPWRSTSSKATAWIVTPLTGPPGAQTYDPSTVRSVPIARQVPSKYVRSTRTTSEEVTYVSVSVPPVAWPSVTVPSVIVGGVLSTSIGATTVVFEIVRLFITTARKLPPTKLSGVVSHRNVPFGGVVVPIAVQPLPPS